MRRNTGICFIGERPFREFLNRYLSHEPGVIEDDRGRAIGRHVGLSFYTLGPCRLVDTRNYTHTFAYDALGRLTRGEAEQHESERAGTDVYDSLCNRAAEVPAGCEGLQFLPYLSGERTPYPDPLARGAFAGLTIRHGLAHMTRAVLEGVAFGLRPGRAPLPGAARPAGLSRFKTGCGAG